MMPMRRIMMLLTVGLVMAAMMLTMAMPAFAVGRVGSDTRGVACEQVASHGAPHFPKFCRSLANSYGKNYRAGVLRGLGLLHGLSFRSWAAPPPPARPL